MVSCVQCISSPCVMQFSEIVFVPHTSGCIFDEIGFFCRPISLELKSSRMRRKKKWIENQKGSWKRWWDFLCVFWLHFTPIKITFNSIWMSWSTVLCWVPINNRRKKMLHSSRFSGCKQLYNSHFNQGWIRLRTAAFLLRAQFFFFFISNEREPFFSVIIAHSHSHSFIWITEAKKEKKKKKKKNYNNNEIGQRMRWYLWLLRFTIQLLCRKK